MSDLPTNVEDFDTYMVGVLAEHHDSSDESKKLWVYDRLIEFLSTQNRNDNINALSMISAASIDYIDRFGSQSERRVAIRRVINLYVK